MAARAELIADEEDFQDIERRLSGERETIQDLERRHAEAGAALRAAQHALKLEAKRRAKAEEALDEASILADQRRLAVTALRAENDTLRARLGEAPGSPVPFEQDEAKLPHALSAYDTDEDEAVAEPQLGGSVVPLPTRARQMAAESPDQSVAVVTEATRDLQRIAGEADADVGKEVWRAPAAAQPRMPAAIPPAANIGELVALRITSAGENGEQKPRPGSEQPAGSAENRFFEALAEIRALKRAANQAGE
jgi:hypothetical protein